MSYKSFCDGLIAKLNLACLEIACEDECESLGWCSECWEMANGDVKRAKAAKKRQRTPSDAILARKNDDLRGSGSLK